MFHAPRKHASHFFIIGSQVNKRGGGGREMGTNDDVRDVNAMAWHQCARTHGFQHPVTSSKAT